MRFGVLGPLQVWSAGGEPVGIGGPRPRALLVMLLLDAGRVVGVDRLVAGQYGDRPPAGAAGAVQTHVSRLRRVLPADLVEHHPGGYRLAVDPDDVDVHRFERLVRQGRDHLAGDDPAGAAAALREALALWRGPALADLPHGAAQAARLEELRLAATEDLVEAELALPAGTSIADLRALVAAHPLRERPRGQLMRALHAAGRRADALAEFDRARRLLADELGVDPSPELAEVHLAVLGARRATRPAVRRPAAPFTSFVGRERELARLRELRGTRLVTVLGPGGIGKTRLATEFARHDGREVCFVDLSGLPPSEPISSGATPGGSTPAGPVPGGPAPFGRGADDRVAHAVLAALGLRATGLHPSGEDPVRRLVAALDRDLLLVLDNCEHRVTEVAVLVRTLLAECPAPAVLATSREPLGLVGENLVPLSPLEVPAPDTPVDGAVRHSAVRLFADRAAAVRPGFAVRPDHARAVVAICAALDGLPLAIELAAARLRQFTVEDVAARLAGHDRFRLLSRGDRTAAARHRTLHAAVAWSWDLLDRREQVLAARFSVFSGGAARAAVEAVCGMPDAEDVLAGLVDKSLVDTDGTRYRMLDTIRLFCAERLEEAGERERVHRAHARHHLDLARRADPHLRGPDQLDWLAALSAEHDNLMAALRWSADAADPADREIGYRMVAALTAYWWLSGRHSQARECAVRLLDAGGVPEGLDEEYVACVAHAGPRAAPEQRRRAGRVVGARGWAARHPFVLAVWGMVAGPPEQPVRTAEPPPGTDPWTAALGEVSTGLLALFGGRVDEGERRLADALTAFQSLGERWGTTQGLDGLAHVAAWRGEWDRARELWARALDLLGQLGALEESAELLCRRAECSVRQGDLDAATADYRRAADLLAEAGRPAPSPVVHLGLGEIARLRGDARLAGDELDRALDLARTGGFDAEPARVGALTALGRLAEARGDLAGARRRHGEALAAARCFPLVPPLARAVEGLAGTALLAGSGERAAVLLGGAVAVRGTAVAGDPDVARTARAARDLIGADAFAEAYARGAASSRHEVLAVAEGETRP